MFTKRLNKLVEKITLTAAFWIGFPILYALSSPFYIFRPLLKHLAKHFHPDFLEMVNVRDAVNYENLKPNDDLLHEHVNLLEHGNDHDLDNEDEHFGSTTTMTSVMTLGLVAQGEPNLEKIRNFFRDYVLNFKNYKGEQPYRKFHCYYESWLGYAFWKKAKDFRLEDHIRFLEELETGKDRVSQEELEIFLGDYNSRPFPWKTPPWELLCVRNFVESSPSSSAAPSSAFSSSFNQCQNQNQTVCNKNQGLNFSDEKSGHCCGEEKKFVLIFRWQKTIADGSSMFKIFVNMFGGETSASLSSESSLNQHHIHHLHTPEQSWWTSLRYYAGSVLLLGYDTIKLLVLDNDANIWRVSEELLQGKCHMVTTNRLPFNVARTISKKRNVSVTSVLFTAVAGALRQYFIEAGQERRIPKFMRVRVAVPLLSHPISRLTNQWSHANIKLPVGTLEPCSRLYKVDKAVELLRKSFVPGFVWLLGPFHTALPHWLRQLSLHDKRTTLSSWYFAGPKQQLLLFGEYPGLDIISFLPRLQSDSTIGLTIFSYNGTIRYTLCIDKALFPHRESAVKLVRLIEKNFFELQNLQPSTASSYAESRSQR